MRVIKAIRWVGIIAVFGAAVSLSSCGKKKTEVKSASSAAETAGTTTAARTTTAAEVADAPGSERAESASGSEGKNAASLKTRIDRYQKNSVTVEYPVVSGMSDEAQQEKLNARLKENALSVLTNYPDSAEPVDQERDALNIRCEVVSADANRIVAVYQGDYFMEGGAHPSNLFYTNTVDARSLRDMRLRDAADPYTMAAYALAEDVSLKDKNPELLSDYRDWQKSTRLEQYQACLESADFPLQKGSDGKTVSWPDSFSYSAEGTLFFSVPVPHFMGDYVIVEYDMTTK